jgi:hypothetical protein
LHFIRRNDWRDQGSKPLGWQFCVAGGSVNATAVQRVRCCQDCNTVFYHRVTMENTSPSTGGFAQYAKIDEIAKAFFTTETQRLREKIIILL